MTFSDSPSGTFLFSNRNSGANFFITKDKRDKRDKKEILKCIA